MPEDILTEYQGIVITGSHYNCRDRKTLSWFEDLVDVIRQAADKGYPKIYGNTYASDIYMVI